MTSTLTNAHSGSSAGSKAASPPASPTLARSRFSGLAGSSILAIANEVRALLAAGRQVCNLTIGDFDPREFPIPESLRERIVAALTKGETNYPPSSGMPALREQVAALYAREFGLTIPTSSIVITGGSRPAIYGAYQLVTMPGDRVVFPVPSWNNDHYCTLSGAVPVAIECSSDTAFLPTAAMLAPHLKGARMLVLNSPVNPTGTAFDAATLGAICDAVLEENARRAPGDPLYLLYDQVYWMLTFGGLEHVMPQVLRPDIAPYTILVDGISKGFAATGLRAGWICAPAALAPQLDAFLGHVGAWAPRPVQVATAQMLADPEAVATARHTMQVGLERRLTRLYTGLAALRDAGLPVEVVAPQGGIYLSARFGTGAKDPAAPKDAMRRYLLEEAGLAAVPFEAFGFAGEPGWFRLSVGSVSEQAIDELLGRLRAALESPRRPA